MTLEEFYYCTITYGTWSTGNLAANGSCCSGIGNNVLLSLVTNYWKRNTAREHRCQQ